MTEVRPEADNATAQAHAGKVFASVARHIELVTRFESDDLHANLPEVEADASMTFGLLQKLDFSIETTNGNGRLPAGVDDAHNESGMDDALHRQLANTEARAPQDLQQWVSDDDGSYMRLVPSNQVRLPRPVGCQAQCSSCHGRGAVTCPTCFGGKVTCGTCNGRGRTDCYSCYGRGSTVCSPCGGTGYRGEYRNNQSVQVHCHSCNGPGRQTCYGCSSTGQVTCRDCHGGGKVTCRRCHGSAQIDCDYCAATGWCHRYGRIHTRVSMSSYVIDITALDEAGAAELNAIALDRLPTLGQVVGRQHVVQGHQVQSRYQVHMPQQKAHLRAADRDFTVYGFGPLAAVFNFQNIAGHLLQGDLQVLQSALQNAKNSPLSQSAMLLPALGDFTRSELNLVIAEEISEAKDENHVMSSVEERYSGLVTKDYVQEASTAFRLALSRIYSSQVREPALASIGIAFLASGLLTYTGWPSGHWLVSVLVALMVCSALWLGAEVYVHRSIATHFEGPLGQRILDICRRTPAVRRWSRGTWITVTIAALAGGFAARNIPMAYQFIQHWLST